MSPAVISVEKLGKEYVIGGREHRGDTFREMIVSAAAAPFRRLKRLSGEVIPEDRIWALKDVSFEVEEGEVVGIIGGNGAGKSTLLKILSRITAPTEGRVKIRGRVSSLLEVGTGFHPELTGRENVYLNGAILGMSRSEIRKKFDEIVDFAGVETFLDTPVKRYSSGMGVRLAFAVAAHLETEILLVDEVLAVGDADFQRKCLGKMSDVAHSGRTILFVSHNMAAISSLCSRGLYLENGRLAFSGGRAECIGRYTSGSRRTNMVNGALVRRAEFRVGEAETNSVGMGQPVSLHVDFQTPAATRRPRIGVVLKRKSTGEAVFGIDSDMLGITTTTVKATQFQAEFVFDELSLVQGEYLATLYVGCDGQNHEVLDAGPELYVNETDVFGTGRLPFVHTGPIFVRPKLLIIAAGG